MTTALHALVATRTRRLLLAGTLALGVLCAVLVAGDARGGAALATVSVPVHSAMSVTLPLLVIATVADRRDRRPPGAPVVRWFASTLAAAVALGAGVGLVGGALVVVTAGSAPVAVLVGGVLVEVLTALCGAGFALLVGRPLLAAALDVLLPSGLWALVAVTAPGLAWLLPYGVVPDVLAGRWDTLGALRIGVTVVVWGPGLVAAGLARTARRGATGGAVRVPGASAPPA